jgi:hypothetical protein
LKELKKRRQTEMQNLMNLTGRSYEDWDVVMNEEKNIPVEDSYKVAANNAMKNSERKSPFWIFTLGVVGLAAAVGINQKRKV